MVVYNEIGNPKLIKHSQHFKSIYHNHNSIVLGGIILVIQYFTQVQRPSENRYFFCNYKTINIWPQVFC